MCVSPLAFTVAVIQTDTFDRNWVSETYFTGTEIRSCDLFQVMDHGPKAEPYQICKVHLTLLPVLPLTKHRGVSPPSPPSLPFSIYLGGRIFQIYYIVKYKKDTLSFVAMSNQLAGLTVGLHQWTWPVLWSFDRSPTSSQSLDFAPQSGAPTRQLQANKEASKQAPNPHFRKLLFFLSLDGNVF